MKFESPYERTNVNRETRLKGYFDVVSKNYGKGDAPKPSHDKDVLASIENNKGEISGRTALITEIVLTDYVNSLMRRNEEIKRTLSSNDSFNRANLEEELYKNNEKINVVKQNCLRTLGEINDNLF